MPRVDSHPIAFMAGEAIADHASCALLVWETGAGVKYRTVPDMSLSVLIGMHDLLGQMIDQITQQVADDDADDETGADA